MACVDVPDVPTSYLVKRVMRASVLAPNNAKGCGTDLLLVGHLRSWHISTHCWDCITTHHGD